MIINYRDEAKLKYSLGVSNSAVVRLTLTVWLFHFRAATRQSCGLEIEIGEDKSMVLAFHMHYTNKLAQRYQMT